MADYVLFFFQIIYYTLGTVVICGLAVYLCESLVMRLMGGAGTVAVKVTSIIGTPVHEMGHAIMCMIFGHKITDMKLWQPSARDGTLGYVTHKYNPRNIYHQFGNLFIGIGPIFSGLGVLTLVMFLCFPSTLNAYFSSARGMVTGGENGFAIFWEGMKMIPRIIEEFSSNARPLWVRIVGVVTLLSVALHISLSPVDIKGALKAMPIYGALVLITTVAMALIGRSAMDTALVGLRLFDAYLMFLFTIVLVFAAAHICIAVVVWLLRSLFFRH